MIAPSVRHLEFSRDDGQALDFIAGQFIQVHFNYPDGTPTKRSYSLATQHDHNFGINDTVEIAVSYVQGGAATALFTALDEGQQIQCSGPYGRFCLHEKDQNTRYILIGTGTGVTPYRAMLPQLKQLMETRGVEVILLFGTRTEEDLLYKEDFYKFAEDNHNFTFMPCFSRELPANASKDARQGYVAGGVLRGLMVGIIVLAIGMLFTHVRVPHPFIMISTILLGASIFSLAGFVNAVYAKKFDDIAIVPTFILTPLTYLGGVFYSVRVLPEWAQMATKANPIFYMVNAFRYGLLGEHATDVSIWLSYAIMMIFVGLLAALALFLLKRGIGLRS
jgi:ferredoxin-NADP reductase